MSKIQHMTTPRADLGTGNASVMQILLICVLLTLLKFFPPAIPSLLGLLCGWTLLGGVYTIQALSLALFIKFLNPELYSFSGFEGPLSWGVTLLSGIRFWLTITPKSFKLLVPLILFTLIIAMLSALQHNKLIAISLTKLFIFFFVASSLIIGFNSLKESEAVKSSTWLISLTISIILLSLPTFAFPKIAYAVNGIGFQGILNHPQTFGPFLVPLTVWILSGQLFTKNKYLYFALIMVFFLVGLMILSQARTSVAAFGLCIFVTLAVVLSNPKKYPSFRLSRLLGVSILITLITSITLAYSPKLLDKVIGFIFKREASNLSEALSSRSGNIASQWEYFTQHPLIGNGFGVYAWGEAPLGIVEYMGIPISAPVEKGFLPTAILEEIGLLGTIFFLVFLLSIAVRVIKQGNIRWLGVFLACIFVNVGEMVFFSVGGIGLYYWLLMSLATRMSNGITISDISQSRIRLNTLNQPLSQTIRNYPLPTKSF